MLPELLLDLLQTLRDVSGTRERGVSLLIVSRESESVSRDLKDLLFKGHFLCVEFVVGSLFLSNFEGKEIINFERLLLCRHFPFAQTPHDERERERETSLFSIGKMVFSFFFPIPFAVRPTQSTAGEMGGKHSFLHFYLSARYSCLFGVQDLFLCHLIFLLE